MSFKKGTSGNPRGRKKGATNKITGLLRESITEFLESNFDKVQKDFLRLSPKDRARFYVDLLNYALPKYQSTSHDINFDDLTDKQLDLIIDKLTKRAKTDDKYQEKVNYEQ